MAKPILIVPTNGCIRYKGVNYLPSDDPFSCDADEAKRLIAMGAAAPAVKPVAAPAAPAGKTAKEQADEAAAKAKAELLAAIAAAETVEDLTVLLPTDEPEADIQEAFTAKMAQLEAGA